MFVAKDRSHTLVDAQDLAEFTGLSIPVVTQKQRLVIGVAWELVRWHLEEMFGKIEERVDGDLVKTIRVCIHAKLTGRSLMVTKVMSTVDVKHTSEQEVTLEWESSAKNDMIADAALALLAGMDKSPASVKCKMFRVVFGTFR